MKLINRFILIYLLVTAVVLAAGGVISYYIIKDEVNFELRMRFMDRINRAGDLLEHSRRFARRVNERNGLDEHGMVIRRIDHYVPPHVVNGDTMAWHEGLQRMEANVKVAAYKQINGDTYYIAAYGVLVESDDIREAVIKTLLWILGLQTIGAIGVGMVVSGRLFKPFRSTLDRIRNFKLQHSEPIQAKQTRVKEFDELNRFVEGMTTKAVADYRNLKEFAENASHELQTPLSIARGKLELLMETDLDPEQYQYLESTERALSKLSRLSESLGLITKIENHEFDQSEKVDLTHLVRDSLQSFEELLALNSITVEADLQKDVKVNMPPVLADILWTNLFQNAIKHNIPDGRIKVELDSESLTISNTGKPLKQPPEQLFERFRKDDQNSGSIGLGLSIVKRITDQCGFNIFYRFEEPCHILSVKFPG